MTDDSAKIGLRDMINFTQMEIEGIDAWERILHSEGEALYPGMEQRRLYHRKIVATLELVLKHQPEIVEMINRKRETEQRRLSTSGSRARSLADH